MTGLTLTDDQQKATVEILAAQRVGGRALLTGHAGAGKTTLMQVLARAWLEKGLSVVMTAPTHKAVAVLAEKLCHADLGDVPCRTVHSLLQLKAKPDHDRMVFVRDKRAEPVLEDVVVIDECSMLGEELMMHIRRHLPRAFVLFVGDPAQLPPVNEIASQSFETTQRSHLATIVRQAAGNPILDAAHAIRVSQGGPMDWSWCKTARTESQGVFVPGNADAWMHKAFTSPDYDANPDSFRYLAWRNQRVADVNRKVQRWRYGDNLPSPFMAGERLIFRAPVIAGGETVFATNEEADVVEIQRSAYRYDFDQAGPVPSWTAELPRWRVTLRRGDDEAIPVFMPEHERDLDRVINRLKDEASACRDRWGDLHDFRASMARLQAGYALTCHTSQGSTFRAAFVDIADIRIRAKDDPLEAQKMLYVAATRPSHQLMLVGA